MNTNIIAIDGPAGVGKGTLAAKLASHYGWATLDTGSLYRAVALHLLEHGFDMENIDEAGAVTAAAAMTASGKLLEYSRRPEIRRSDISQYTSKIAAIPKLREAIRQYQVDFGRHPPNGAKGAIAEGRDIGTAIFPDAPVKIFLTARPEVKARRRYDEYREKGAEADYNAILSDMMERDRRDTTRADNPLVPSQDAVIIDTSDMDREQVFEAARRIVDERIKL
ncbi:MAG: (d)CMP kinase [Rickettsiales bacterium]|jgi:cytidylate kinase|nr:(d)CMP kinase [Rickettsiales bacterium]